MFLFRRGERSSAHWPELVDMTLNINTLCAQVINFKISAFKLCIGIY